MLTCWSSGLSVLCEICKKLWWLEEKDMVSCLWWWIPIYRVRPEENFCSSSRRFFHGFLFWVDMDNGLELFYVLKGGGFFYKCMFFGFLNEYFIEYTLCFLLNRYPNSTAGQNMNLIYIKISLAKNKVAINIILPLFYLIYLNYIWTPSHGAKNVV